jgi:hypothetical protein
MEGEIISIHVGGMGIKSAENLWKKNCSDNKISLNSQAENKSDSNIKQFFRQIGDKYKPRAIFVDTNSEDIDYIKSFEMKNLFDSTSMKSFKGKDVGNFGDSFYISGPAIILEVMEMIQKEVERCENLNGIIIYNSVSGGTSGLGALISNRVNEEFSKTNKIGIIDIQPNSGSKIPTSAYNSILSLNK